MEYGILGRHFLSICFFSFFKFIYLFIYFWLCWVFVSVRGLSLVVASGGHASSRCAGLSLSRLLLLWSTGSRRAGSVVVAHGPSCSMARGIFPDQGSNPCPLHWQADSQPLRHQGSPICFQFHHYAFKLLFSKIQFQRFCNCYLKEVQSNRAILPFQKLEVFKFIFGIPFIFNPNLYYFTLGLYIYAVCLIIISIHLD